VWAQVILLLAGMASAVAHPLRVVPPSPQALVSAAAAGARVVVPPGEYTGGLVIDRSMTVGLNGVRFRGLARSRAVISVVCDRCTVVIEDFFIHGPDSGCETGNCAGIKIEGVGFSVELRRGHIDNTAFGVLTDNRGGSLLIEDTLIENAGRDNQSETLGHGVYAGVIDELRIINSTVRRSGNDGHLVKSRAQYTLVQSSVVAGLDGRHSRTIDLPCGGVLVVRDSILQHGANSDNRDLIGIALEFGLCAHAGGHSQLAFHNNWIIFDRDRSADERSRDHGDNTLFNVHPQAYISHLSFVDNRLVEPTSQLQHAPLTVEALSGNNRWFASRAAAGLSPHALPVR
jgi:hypothetical protein